jgi:hypothetical protein
VKEGLGVQTTPDVNFEFYLDEVRPIGHAAWLHVVCTYGKWINICWLCSLKTLGGATRCAAKPSSSVFIVALISGSGQVEAAKDLWERNLGAIVKDRVASACILRGTSVFCFGLFN